MIWGAKGCDYYWHQPILHIKIALFIVIAILAIKPTRAFAQWHKMLLEQNKLPCESEIKRIRRYVMWQAHLMIGLPILGAMLTYGVFAK